MNIYDLMFDFNYKRWMEALSEANFVTGKDILEGKISLDTCNIFLYHDMDGARDEHLTPIVQVEKTLGIRSTIYLLLDDGTPKESYYKKSLKDLLKLQHLGFEFGYHVNAVRKCKRIGDTVDPEEAYKKLSEDIEWLKKQGFDIRTMSAHGFTWPDGKRPEYDNWQLEYDATERGCPVVSQYHLSKKFVEVGGTRIEDSGVTFGKRIWKKWHTIETKECISLLMDDSCCNWQQLSISFLAELIPHLKGCLIRILIHPVSWHIVNEELEFKYRVTSIRDNDVSY